MKTISKKIGDALNDNDEKIGSGRAISSFSPSPIPSH
jgi:hypothetical protein